MEKGDYCIDDLNLEFLKDRYDQDGEVSKKMLKYLRKKKINKLEKDI